MAMIEIKNEVHKMVIKKQIELFELTNKKINLSEIASKAIEKGIDFIDP